jgi:hypothetical protein
MTHAERRLNACSCNQTHTASLLQRKCRLGAAAVVDSKVQGDRTTVKNGAGTACEWKREVINIAVQSDADGLRGTWAPGILIDVMNDNSPLQKDTLIGKGVLPLVEVMQLLQRPGVSLPVRVQLKRDGKKQQGVVSLTARFDADDSALATAAAAVAAATAAVAAATAAADTASNSDGHSSNELLELRITGLKAEGLANTEMLSFVNKQDPYVKAAIGDVHSNSSFTANGAGTSAVWYNAVLKLSVQSSVLAAAGAKLQLVSHAMRNIYLCMC